MSTGLVHLYVGDGKGKTTAAVGLAARALGCGKSVLVCQFLKGQQSGEVAALERLGATVLRSKGTDKFTFQMTPGELAECSKLQEELLDAADRQARGGGVDLVILDEVVDAVNSGTLPLSRLLETVRGRDSQVEMVLTGRNPPGEVVELSDYHTHFQCISHPYQRGVPAREGVEY